MNIQKLTFLNCIKTGEFDKKAIDRPDDIIIVKQLIAEGMVIAKDATSATKTQFLAPELTNLGCINLNS